MKRLLFVMLVAAACGGSSGPQTAAAPTSKRDPGAATPSAAVAAFMGAVKEQDLDALRKRELIMECYFQHDSYRVVSDVSTTATQHVFTLSVTKGSFTRETKTQVVLGPHDRWFVANPELAPLQDLCSGQSSTKN